MKAGIFQKKEEGSGGSEAEGQGPLKAASSPRVLPPWQGHLVLTAQLRATETACWPLSKAE